MTKIYLISPEDFALDDFNARLENLLQKFDIDIFQLRIKNKSHSEVRQYAKKLLDSCNKYGCKFIINDYADIALEIGAHGVHVGQDDIDISQIRSRAQNKDFIIGVSCYDSIDIATDYTKKGASYVSFGTFFPSNTKNSHGKPDITIIPKMRKCYDVPIVAIGGIDSDNCGQLVKNKVDYLAIISYIWNNPLGEEKAMQNLLNKLNSID